MSSLITYFSYNDWQKHNDVVYEAPGYMDADSCHEIISYIDAGDTSCSKHEHTHHTPNNVEVSDTFTWLPECFQESGDTVAPLNSFDGISRVIHGLKDAAVRYTNKGMILSKVVVHRYGPGASGPEHSDVYPLATLLYLNDDYEGGEVYFSSGLELHPGQGSILAFDGGGVNRHGVRQVTGNVARYVLVAFWEYEVEDETVKFWNLENQAEDERNNSISAMIERKGGNDPDAEMMFADRFPILRIESFVTREEADQIINYLNVNDMNPEETWGPICFREYWKVAYGTDEQPIYTEGIDENTLPNINARIKKAVARFMEMDEDALAFSKFKGHNHVKGAYSPPHTHGPAIAVATLVLNDFEGGEVFIPAYDIEFKPKPLCLYVYSESNDLKHGVRQVTDGDRKTLVSHWQNQGHEYNKAGANV